MNARRLGAPLVLFLFAAMPAGAQSYPVKPVRQIVSGGPGGPSDMQTRAIGQALGAALGQPFIAESRAGANGAIALEACAKAPPDGHTLCSMDGAAVVFNPLLRRQMPVSAERDIAPVIHGGFYVSALVAHPSLAAGTVRELIEMARAKPGAIAWATAGAASSGNLYAEWMKSTQGAAFLTVPYKSNPEALAATLSSQVQVTIFALGGAVPQVKSGKLKALAVTSERRMPDLPGVPTFEEAGLDINSRNWLGIFAPAAVPRDIIQRLNAEIARLFADAAFREKNVAGLGLEHSGPAGRTAEEFAAFLKGDRARAEQLLRLAGVKPE